MAISKARVLAAVTSGFKAAGDLTLPCTLTRETPGVSISATEASLGTLEANAATKTIAFTAGDVTALGFAAGQKFRVQWVPGWPSYIDYTIVSVTPSTIATAQAIPDIAAVGRFEIATVATPIRETATGQALFDQRQKLQSEYFSDLEIGPSDQIVWLSGLSFGPREGDRITIGGSDYTARWVDDVMQAGAIWQAVVR